jgi:hypothetical protein
MNNQHSSEKKIIIYPKDTSFLIIPTPNKIFNEMIQSFIEDLKTSYSSVGTEEYCFFWDYDIDNHTIIINHQTKYVKNDIFLQLFRIYQWLEDKNYTLQGLMTCWIQSQKYPQTKIDVISFQNNSFFYLSTFDFPREEDPKNIILKIAYPEDGEQNRQCCEEDLIKNFSPPYHFSYSKRKNMRKYLEWGIIISTLLSSFIGTYFFLEFMRPRFQLWLN